nr:ribonuclease H-like domain-containing protein [Tanacetum cinerariifolium]
MSCPRPCFKDNQCINDLKKANPQQALKDKGVIDSGCSRHMTGNMSYLSDFEELNGGYVSFGGNPKDGKITGKGSGLAWFPRHRKSRGGRNSIVCVFPVLSNGSANPKNNNKDVLVDGKEHDDDIQKSVSPDIHFSSCGDQTREQDQANAFEDALDKAKEKYNGQKKKVKSLAKTIKSVTAKAARQLAEAMTKLSMFVPGAKARLDDVVPWVFTVKVGEKMIIKSDEKMAEAEVNETFKVVVQGVIMKVTKDASVTDGDTFHIRESQSVPFVASNDVILTLAATEEGKYAFVTSADRDATASSRLSS